MVIWDEGRKGVKIVWYYTLAGDTEPLGFFSSAKKVYDEIIRLKKTDVSKYENKYEIHSVGIK